jgi:hypothetical protein
MPVSVSRDTRFCLSIKVSTTIRWIAFEAALVQCFATAEDMLDFLPQFSDI